MATLIRRSPMKEYPTPQIAKKPIPRLTTGGLTGMGSLVDPPNSQKMSSNATLIRRTR